jgi:urease accessory protein
MSSCIDRFPSAARTAALLAACALLPAAAGAHPGTIAEHAGQVPGFVDGFLHPFTGLDHLGATLAVGLWSARNPSRVWAAPAAFLACLVIGALASRLGLLLPDVEPMIAFSLLALGLLLASRTYVTPALAALLVGGFAFFHGAAHGVELAAPVALSGMLCATALLLVAGTAIGGALRQRSPWWTRGTGVALALFGIAQLAG